ncbi:ROK family protein, partial [candidate division KSB1 bacterium]
GGIDIGGTKIRMGLVDSRGRVFFHKMFLTPVRKPWENTLDLLVNNFHEMIGEADTSYADLSGIGIGCPGTFDKTRENIRFAPNLEWRNIPIKAYLNDRFPVPVFFENDTNLSTLGVANYGEGRGKKTIIGIFIGTGIGGGIIVDKELFIGSTGGAGEIGHMVIRENGPKCHCGNRGCLESIASTSAIYDRIHRQYRRRYKQTETYADFTANANKSLAVRKAYYSGEKTAAAIIEDAFSSLGMGLVSLINLFNPDMIVLGGGLMEALGEVILEKTVSVVKESAMPGTYEKVQIVKTRLGDDAPIVGGAALVEHYLKTPAAYTEEAGLKLI